MNKKFTELAKDIYRLTVLFPSREPLRYKLREVSDDIIVEYVMEKNDYFGNIRRNLELIYSFLDIAAAQNWVSPARIGQVRDNYALAAQQLTEMKLAQEIANGNAVKNEMEAQKNEPKNEPVTDFVLVPQEPETKITPAPNKNLVEAEIPSAPMIVEQPMEPKEDVPNMEKATVKASIFQEISITKDELEGEDEEGEESEEDEEKNGLAPGQIARQNRIVEFLKANGNAQVWEIQKIFPSVSKRTIRRDFRSMLKQGLIERTGERNTTAYKLKIILS